MSIHIRTSLCEKTGLEEPHGYGGIPTYSPEKLSLWDRLFNRTRKEVHDRGTTQRTRFYRYDNGFIVPGSESTSEVKWVEYRVIDRLTGSVTIEREYLT